MQKITPFLWFDNQAEEAAEFYISLLPNSKITQVARYGDAGPGSAGSVMTVEFQLAGQTFVALNGGPMFTFSEATSFAISCDSQDEIDGLWSKLLADGGQEQQCGWIKDKYGLAWQVVPAVLDKLMTDSDAERARRVTEAMMGMVKLDIAELEKAHAG